MELTWYVFRIELTIMFKEARDAFAVAAAVCLLASQSAWAAANDGSVPAIWRIQSVPFEFNSDSISYTCEAFKKKVSSILISVGVHPSLIVHARCVPVSPAPSLRVPDTRFTSGLTSRVFATLALASPVIANEENIREATTFSEERKLIARMNEEELPTAADIPKFAARWAAVSIDGAADALLDSRDCELLRQLSRQVFPRIGVEVIKSRLVCSPSVISKPEIDVRALMPTVQIGEAARPSP